MKELGILPPEVREVGSASYNATLYSAIDVLEPRNNVAVWKMELSNSQKNADKGKQVVSMRTSTRTTEKYTSFMPEPDSGGMKLTQMS